MSFESWCKEFYPVDADKVPEGNALKHSLRKWEGLLPKNLKRHGLRLDRSGSRVRLLSFAGTVREFLIIDSSSCALCVHFWPDDPCSSDFCARCPLSKIPNAVCQTVGSPWIIFVDTGEPLPMIRALRGAIEMEAGGKETKVKEKK